MLLVKYRRRCIFHRCFKRPIFSGTSESSTRICLLILDSANSKYFIVQVPFSVRFSTCFFFFRSQLTWTAFFTLYYLVGKRNAQAYSFTCQTTKTTTTQLQPREGFSTVVLAFTCSWVSATLLTLSSAAWTRCFFFSIWARQTFHLPTGTGAPRTGTHGCKDVILDSSISSQLIHTSLSYSHPRSILFLLHFVLTSTVLCSYFIFNNHLNHAKAIFTRMGYRCIQG